MDTIKSLVEFFQSTISPLVLISGVGLILLSLTNRLARTIDRSRGLVAEIEDETSGNIENKKIQLRILVKRSYILKYSITAISFSILCSSLIIPILLIMYLYQYDLAIVGKLFFLLSIIGIIFSAIFLFIDVSLTLKALEHEVKEYILKNKEIKMEFVVIAHDYKDEKAIERRMTVREKHLINARKMFEDGRLLFASALLSDDGKMNGSVMFVNFPTEDDLRNEWLHNEVYVTGKVWEEIIVRKVKVAKH